MESYGLLVKVPIITPPRFDGTRDTSVDFQASINTLIDELLVEFAVEYMELPGESRDGWVGCVLEALDLPGDPPQLDLF